MGLFFVARESMCRKESASMYCTNMENYYLVSISDNANEFPIEEAESGFSLNEEQIGVCAIFDSMHDAINFSKAAKPLITNDDLSFLYSDNGKVAMVIYASFYNQKLFNLLSEFSFDISQTIPQWSLTLNTFMAIEELSSL